jgi:hypothetical protein
MQTPISPRSGRSHRSSLASCRWNFHPARARITHPLAISVLDTMCSNERLHAVRGALRVTRLMSALMASLTLSFVLAACGESEQAKAEKTVCAAKQEIASSVQNLQSLTITSASVSTVQRDLGSIGEGLKKMRGAEGQLSSTRKTQVQKANTELSTQLSSFTHELTRLTLPEAQAQVASAIDKVVARYKNAFAPIQC